MHLVGWLHAGHDDAALARAAHARGVVASPLGALSIVPRSRGALLLGFAGFDAPVDDARDRGVVRGRAVAG
jgi:DNA-binding transcriptional MocR family regulator